MTTRFGNVKDFYTLSIMARTLQPLDPGITSRLQKAEASYRRAVDAERAAAADRGRAVLDALDNGASLRQVAAALGITFARVQQIAQRARADAVPK
jgi:hypothetical protein